MSDDRAYLDKRVEPGVRYLTMKAPETIKSRSERYKFSQSTGYFIERLHSIEFTPVLAAFFLLLSGTLVGLLNRMSRGNNLTDHS